MPQHTRPTYVLGPMPLGRAMTEVDGIVAHAPLRLMFDIARRVEEWPAHLDHYRFVRFRERSPDGGGLVEMSAYRQFGMANWPTWWLSEMSIDDARPAIRFRHVEGITSGMDVEWTFREEEGGNTRVEIIHAWDGPRWPAIGVFSATMVIGPVFIHAIASRTLAGLAAVAEREARRLKA